MNKTVILASSNQGKLNEFSELLKPLALDVRPQGEFNVSDFDETGLTFIENALGKARHASLATELPAIGDDSGLVVPALNGEPGIYSARYSGEHGNSPANIDKLLSKMEGVDDRRAYFYCVIVYVKHANDPIPVIATGKVEGLITTSPSGSDGFGYDPVFYVESLKQTFAEVDKATKNAISHRAQASQSLLAALGYQS